MRVSNRIRPLYLVSLIMLVAGLALAGPLSRASAATPIYVRPDGNDTECDGTVDAAYPSGSGPLPCAVQTIQKGVDLADPGGTALVAPGTYNESPNITKSLTLQSTGGRDVTTIVLQSGPTYLGGLTIDAPIVTVDGFTIVGFDAVGSGLASSNIVVTTAPDDVKILNNRVRVGEIGPGSNGDDGMGLINYYSTGSDVDSLVVTGNIFEPVSASGSRAFFINPGVKDFTFSQNEITGNFTRTAITQAKNGLVEENIVTGAGAPGSRSRGLGTWGYPDPTVYGHTTFHGNTISNTNAGIAVFETEDVIVENNFFSDNDYGVRVRPSVPLSFDVSTIHISGNSLLNSLNDGVNKDAAVTGVLDASANWWGVDTPAGVAAEVSAAVDYTPWLDIGADTSGDPGFQGDFSVLNVDDDSPQTGTEGRIQEGIDLVTASTVNVYPGFYDEFATNRYVLGVNGPHQFGLFIDADNVTVQGVDGGGAPITNYAGVLAEVQTNATNNFGYAGIFVEGDNFTLAGLRILDNVAGNNKTIEITGDNFTLKYSHLDISDGGSVYFGDWLYDDNGTPANPGDDTSHIQSYTVEANWLDHSTSMDLANGAGFSGLVSGRVIKDNRFDNGEYWPSISFNGSGTGVPWFVYSVGGAVIEGNDFVNTFNGDGNPLHDSTAAHIRARGAYDNSQFDWTSYWNDNTFNKAAVALIGAYPPFDVRTYSYVSGSYTFNDVRRIGARIQPEVNTAQSGDTALVNQGAYVEQVTVNKTLDLVGEDGALLTFIQAPATLTGDLAIVTMTGAGVSVDFSGLTVTGPGPSGCGSINYGILVRDDAYANIHDNRILDVRDNPIGGCQNGVAIQVGRAALGTNGSADITNNIVSGYQKNGITVSNSASSATITNNTVTGAGAVTFIAQNGIQVSGGATGNIVGNTVSGHSYTPFSYVSTGMLLYGAGPTNTSGNTVSENQVGIYVIDTPGSHDGNTVSASSAGTGSPGFWGIVVDSPPPAHQPSPLDDLAAPGPRAQLPSVNSLVATPVQVVTVTNNVLTGDGTAAGIGLEADSGFGSFDIDLTATNNYIQNWGVGVEIFECGAPYTCTGTTFANLNVNLNSITGNLTGYDHYNASFTAGGEKNWWSHASGPSGSGPGTGDPVSANVDFDPWLCDGTDTDPAIGFQPSLLYVCSGVAPAIAVEKNGPTIAAGGDPVTYQYEVTNTGTVPLSAVSVSDDHCGAAAYLSGDADSNGKLDIGEIWVFACTYTPAFSFPNPLTNIATTTGAFENQTAEDTDDFTLHSFFLRKKVFLYWNSARNTIVYAQPDNTPFTVEVYKNNVLVGTYTISQNAPQRLWLSAGSYKFKEVNLPPGYLAGYSSIFFTTGQYPDWAFPNVITSDLAIDKTGPTTARKGQTITYTYTVTNAGPASVKPKVTDNKCSPVTYVSGDTDGDGRVDPGETWTFKCKYKVTQNPNTTLTNKATVKDAQRPSSGWFLGGDRNSSNNSDTWTLQVVP